MKITISSTEPNSRDNINVAWESSHDEHTVENFLKHLSETLKLSRTNLILVMDSRTLKKGVRKRLYKLCDKVFS